MKTFSIAIIVVMFLSACQTTNEDRGALLGAVAGGILGNQIGDGRGQLLATGLGAMLGGIAGSSVGARMDKVDQMKLSQAYQKSLEQSRSGEQTTWVNPDTGNSGSIEPIRTYQTSTGKYCREFQQSIIVGGKTEQGHGTACRQPDGSWKIVGG